MAAGEIATGAHGIDVDLDDLQVLWRRRGEAVGVGRVGARADEHDRISFGEVRVCVGSRTVGADHAKTQGVRLRDRTLAVNRGCNWNTGLLRQTQQFGPG